MFNKLFTIGPFTVYMYGVMIAAGVLTAVLVSMRRAKKRGLVPDEVLSFALYGMISGVIGAKLMYCIVHLKEVFADPSILWNGNGMLVYGAIIGAIGTLFLYCRKRKLVFLDYFDLIMPAIPIAQGFGRIGCFFAGCCYGKETHTHFGIVFPEGSLAPSGVPLWPTQLMSAGWHFVCAAILFLFEKNPKHRRTVGIAYLTLFGTGRFIIDFFRGDKQNVVNGVSLSQIGSILLAVAGAASIALILRYREKKAAEADGPQEEQGEDLPEEEDEAAQEDGDGEGFEPLETGDAQPEQEDESPDAEGSDVGTGKDIPE